MNSDVSCSNKVSDTVNAIFSFKNLYDAYEKCIRGVKWKWSTQNYMVNACCRIARLRNRILEGTYRSPKPRKFTVNERGKTREITALGFEDRIVNKCLCDVYLNPVLAKSLIHDNGATVKGKGLSFTKDRLVCHLQKYYRKYGSEGYALKLDVHHYFESINHDILMNKISKKVKDLGLLKIIRQIVDTCDKGLGLGSQVSQISAIYYLNDVDHFIKEKLHCKFYGRYMDDMYILSSDIAELENIRGMLAEVLKEYKLELNRDKSQITRLVDGFVFCKTRYVLSDTGQVLKFMTSSSVASMKRKIKLGIDVSNILPSFKSYVKDFTAKKLLRQFEKEYVM